MEYNWSTKELKEQQRACYHYLYQTKGLTLEEKDKIKAEINDLKAMKKNRMELSSIPFYFPKKYIDKNKFLPKRNYLESIPLELKKILLKTSSILQDVQNTYDGVDLPLLNLSNQELVEQSQKFYHWLPNKKYEKLFQLYTNPNYHALRFSTLPAGQKGNTTFLYYPKYKPYFCIDRDNTIEDFITLNHEIAHGIIFRNSAPHYFLTELEGEFFDFLSIEYLKDILDPTMIEELEYSRFITAHNNLIDFTLLQLAIQCVQKKKEISLESMTEAVMTNELNISLNESMLLTSLQESPKELTKYLISYLASLDLEEVYHKDPEYSLYLLEAIRKNRAENTMDNLRKYSIRFMDDGNKNLKEKVKTLGITKK